MYLLMSHHLVDIDVIAVGVVVVVVFFQQFVAELVRWAADVVVVGEMLLGVL